IDGPVALVAHTLANLLAYLRYFTHAYVCVESAAVLAKADSAVDAEGAVAGLDRSSSAFLHRQVPPAGAGRGIAVHKTANRSVQQLVHGRVERLALDIPQRHVERAEGVDLL